MSSTNHGSIPHTRVVVKTEPTHSGSASEGSECPSFEAPSGLGSQVEIGDEINAAMAKILVLHANLTEPSPGFDRFASLLSLLHVVAELGGTAQLRRLTVGQPDDHFWARVLGLWKGRAYHIKFWLQKTINDLLPNSFSGIWQWNVSPDPIDFATVCLVEQSLKKPNTESHAEIPRPSQTESVSRKRGIDNLTDSTQAASKQVRLDPVDHAIQRRGERFKAEEQLKKMKEKKETISGLLKECEDLCDSRDSFRWSVILQKI